MTMTTIDISSGRWATTTRTAAGITVVCDCDQASQLAPVREITAAERVSLEVFAAACERQIVDGHEGCAPAHVLDTLEQ